MCPRRSGSSSVSARRKGLPRRRSGASALVRIASRCRRGSANYRRTGGAAAHGHQRGQTAGGIPQDVHPKGGEVRTSGWIKAPGRITAAAGCHAGHLRDILHKPNFWTRKRKRSSQTLAISGASVVAHYLPYPNYSHHQGKSSLCRPYS